MDSLRSLIPTDKPNMMDIPQKQTASDTKQPLFAEIDLGAEELDRGQLTKRKKIVR